MKKYILIFLLCLAASSQTVDTKARNLSHGASNPATCAVGDQFYNTATPGLVSCSATNTWTAVGTVVAGTGAVQTTSGTLGLVSGTSSNCVLVNGSSAPCDAPGQGAVVNVTPVTVSASSTSAQVLQQLTIPAGLMNIAASAGGAFTYNASGIYTAASLQTPTLTWTLNHCTVSGCGSGTVRALATIVTPSVVTATNNVWNIRLAIANTATGATGTLITHGSAIVELTAASDLGTASSDSNTASTGTIDLTGVTYLQLTVTTSTGNAGNSITADHSSLEPASAIGPTGPTGPAGGPTCESHTASSSSTLNFTTILLTSSPDYTIYFDNIVASGSTVAFQMRMSTNGGSSYDSGSNYNYGILYSGIGDSPTQATGSGVTAINLANSVTTGTNLSVNGNIILASPAGALNKIIYGKTQAFVGTSMYQWNDTGQYLSTTVVNAFQFFFTSGTFSGTIRACTT